MNLNKLIDLKQYEQLQDSLADVTQLAILIVDYKGVPVTKHSGCHEFCQRVRKDPKLCRYCYQCDSRAGFEALKNNKPFIYKCHFSLVDIAIPLIVNNQYIGNIMAGQVRVNANDSSQLEILLNPKDASYTNEKRKLLEQFYSTIPMMTYSRIEVIANMLYYLYNFMFSQTVKKQEALWEYELILGGG